MKNNSWRLLLIISGLSFPCLASSAFAEGGSGSHGGGFVRCYAEDMKTSISVEPADIYEGRTHGGLTYENFTNQWSDQEIAALTVDLPESIPPKRFGARLKEEIKWLRTSPLVKNVGKIDASTDISELITSLDLPKNCEFVQVGKFYTSREQEMSWNEILDRPSPKAVSERWGALISVIMLHESFYKVAADRRGDNDSQKVRRIVALLYSDYFLSSSRFYSDPSFEKRQRKARNEVRKLVRDLWRGRK